jgi:hypothetical protein
MNNVNIVESFYNNPLELVNKLTGEYPIIGCGTGRRSVGLQEIDTTLYQQFCQKIFQIHNLNPRGLHVTTFFMEHEYDPIEIFNQRWVHIDGKNPDVCLMTMDEYKLVLCGQIFLTPNPDPEAGVRICDLKPEINWTEKELLDKTVNFYTQPKDDYLAGKINLVEYTKRHTEYHNNFNLTCDVKNVYNRMVSWKAKTLHGDPMTKKMGKRLNQYFFIQRV